MSLTKQKNQTAEKKQAVNGQAEILHLIQPTYRGYKLKTAHQTTEQ